MIPIEFFGVRGGHGSTTVVLAAAVTLAARRPTRVASHDPAVLCAIAGIASDGLPLELADRLELATEPDTAEVIDAGGLDHVADERLQASCDGGSGGLRVGVLRGPDYLGLRTLCAYQGPSLDGLVVVVEPGRALDARDVETVTDLAVVAVVDHSPAVARLVDAGLFVHRVTRCREFDKLRAWINEIAPAEPEWPVAS